jgi:concanavalin A-like lectin/glucanase superfamily protein
MGPAVEGQVAKLLTSEDRGVAQEACKILRVIGTRASVPDLQTAAQSRDLGLANVAKDALANIAARHSLDLSAIKETKATARPGTSNEPSASAPKRREPPAAARLPGLLAYWDFDDEDAQKAVDLSANSLSGTVRGAKRVPGVRGRALQFAGDDDWFDYGSSPKLNFEANNGFTIAGWVKTTATSGTIVSQRKEGDGSPVLDITIEMDVLAAMVRQDGDEFGQAARVRGKSVNDGEWHHFALVRRENAVELILDGASVGKGQGADAGGPITTDLRALGSERYLLKKTGLGDPTFKGAIDEFCIFGRALTEAEIVALARTRE